MIRENYGRPGFTLVELMVAITICTGMLVWAIDLVDAVAASSNRVKRIATSESLSALRTATLRDLVLNVEAGDSASFMGDAHAARFTSWCDAGFHSRLRCSVVAEIDTSLRVTSRGETTTLWRDSSRAELRYLSDAHAGGAWLTAWGEQPIAPLAMAIVSLRDTSILRIGVRQ